MELVFETTRGFEEDLRELDKAERNRVTEKIKYKDQAIHVKDIIEGQEHDEVLQVIKAKKERYS